MQTPTVSEKVKSDAQPGKIISREKPVLAVKKNRIVTESRSGNRFLTEEFSRIDSNEQTEIKRNNFENPKAALPDNFIFTGEEKYAAGRIFIFHNQKNRMRKHRRKSESEVSREQRRDRRQQCFRRSAMDRPARKFFFRRV